MKRSLLVALTALIVLWTWNVTRHEGSHAVAAWLEGATIVELRLVPAYRPDRGFTFGYVRTTGPTTWRMIAAPYVTAGIVAFVAWMWARRVAPGRMRTAIAVFGIVGPLLDVSYNYQGGLWRAGTDVHRLFEVLPDGVVHTVLGCWVILMVVAAKRLWPWYGDRHTPRA